MLNIYLENLKLWRSDIFTLFFRLNWFHNQIKDIAIYLELNHDILVGKNLKKWENATSGSVSWAVRTSKKFSMAF